MTTAPWMVYGANGYTGELIVDEAVRRGMRPVLGGRSAEKLKAIADRHGLEVRAFGLDDPAAVARGFAGMGAVLHCAGPFFRTSKAVVDGCLAAKAHYLDITGEIAVFEACARRGDEAKAAGIVVLPGTGFDVVPSDCLAASLKAALPTATSLELAFGGGAGLSRGTAKTMVAGLGMGGAVRRGGKIVVVPAAFAVKTIPFRDKPRVGVSIPWGDVATAWRSTRIPDITVYTVAPAAQIRQLKLSRWIGPVLRLPFVQRYLSNRIERTMTGPSESRRESTQMQLWGRVVDVASGSVVEGTLVTPEGYKLTAITAVECVARVLAGGIAAGYQTPSLAFGAGFVATIAGCDLQIGAVTKTASV